jgi:hypothetical protein
MHHSTRWYTSVVPTTRPRHQITETPDVARALDAAARRWPGEPRSKLLLRLLRAGEVSISEAERSVAQRRRSAIERSSEKYPDAFPDNYLGELRKDWAG